MKTIYLHPLPLRIWHWSNALVIIVLLATGFHLRLGGVPSLAPHSLSLAMHKFFGIVALVLWLFWLAYMLASNHLVRQYALGRTDLDGASQQVKFYLFTIFRGEGNPFKSSAEQKFNPLQKLAYGSVMCFLLPIMIVTGLLFVDAFFVRDWLLSRDAHMAIDAIHTAGYYAFAVFLVIHIYMATLGPTTFSHIKAMVTGYGEEPIEDTQDVGGQKGTLAEERKI